MPWDSWIGTTSLQAALRSSSVYNWSIYRYSSRPILEKKRKLKYTKYVDNYQHRLIYGMFESTRQRRIVYVCINITSAAKVEILLRSFYSELRSDGRKSRIAENVKPMRFKEREKRENVEESHLTTQSCSLTYLLRQRF